MFREMKTANSAVTALEIAEENERYFREIEAERQKTSQMVHNINEVLTSEKKQNNLLISIICNQNKMIEIKEKEAKHSRNVNLLMGGIAIVSLIIGITSLFVSIFK